MQTNNEKINENLNFRLSHEVMKFETSRLNGVTQRKRT